MTALARLVAPLLPTESASPTAWRSPTPHAVTPRQWQILGVGRLTLALDRGDHAAAARLVDELLEDDTLRALFASRFLSPAGRALTTADGL